MPQRRRLYAPDVVMHVAAFVLRDGDCAIWALATFLSKPYEEIVAAAAQIDRAGGLNGLTEDDIIAVARMFGVTLERREEIDLDTDTGILGVQFPRYKYGHVAVLKRGQLIDCRGKGISIWDADVWLATRRATTDGILIATRRRPVFTT